jgi:preprotein translocase subunit SecD
MMNCCSRFNTYLVMAVSLLLVTGCKTANTETSNDEKGKDKKPVSTLRLHQEMHADPMGRTEEALVFRAQPVKLIVNKDPFLTEANIKAARVVDTMGGFALSIQFDKQGSWLLEEYTAASKGKHIVVFSQFIPETEHKLNTGRWLAAPLIKNHIADGVFIFTPDASREEAERIALGLNDVASKLQTGQ